MAIIRLAGGPLPENVKRRDRALAEFDARIRLGHCPHNAALDILEELGITKSFDTEELLKGETDDGRSDKPL